MFKAHCFSESIILQDVYFKLRFSLSYRDVEELISIRGIKVDHATIQRWVFKFIPLVEQQDKKDMGLTLEAMRLPLEALGYEILAVFPVFGIFDRGAVRKEKETLTRVSELGRNLAQALLS